MEIPEPEKKAKKLTGKQVRFAQAYARCLNGALAAREASVPPDSAARVAFKWLRLPHVLEYVDELLADDAEQRKVDWDILRQLLRSRCTTDMGVYFKKNGKPRAPGRLPIEARQHVQGFTHSTFETVDKEGNVLQRGTNTTFTATSQLKAAELLGRHSGFFSRETQGNQFNDYLEAESQLAGLLSEQEDEDEDDVDEEGDPLEDEAPREEAEE